jgi:chromosome partitioning protein
VGGGRRADGIVRLGRKPAFVVFTAGNPNAPRIYQEAAELVEGFGTPACPIQIPDRAAYRHASGEGRTVMEYEPDGKAADDIRQIYEWTCRQVGLSLPRKPARKRSAA